MHKGKPLIVGHRPWYRHPALPWGWYSLTQDVSAWSDEMDADGYHRPDDKRGGKWHFDPVKPDHNSGVIIDPEQ